MSKQYIQCQLCGRQNVLAADAHIYPKGFYTFPADKQPLLLTGDGTAHRNRSGIHDDSIVCSDCEHTYFSVDDYAIRILKRHEGGINVRKDNRDIIVFPRIDRLALRKFFASLLWRGHISKKKPVRHISIGDYEPRIRQDILAGGPFDFLDAAVVHLDSEVHSCAASMQRIRFPGGVNGFRILLPHLNCFVSLDQRPMPAIARMDIQLNHSETIPCSTSLASSADKSAWIMPREEIDQSLLATTIEILKSQTANPISRKLLATMTADCEREGIIKRSELGSSSNAFLSSLVDDGESRRATSP